MIEEPTPEEISEIDQELHYIIESVEGIPKEYLCSLYELIDVGGEWEIALEDICSNIVGLNLTVDREMMSRIRTLGNRLGVNVDYYISSGTE